MPTKAEIETDLAAAHATLAEREAEIERLRGLVAAAVETPTGGGEAVNAEALLAENADLRAVIEARTAERQEALAAREAVAAELTAAREELADLRGKQAAHEATAAQLVAAQEQLEALREEVGNPPAPLSPREKVLSGLEELFDFHGIENPREAARVTVIQTVDLIRHSGGRLPDNTTRALMTLQ